MRYRTLGSSTLRVSEICLGSMTWGTQNTESEGHEQMDAAFDAGVNFIDTAQMYPTTPMSAETQGRSEEIIGSWMAARGNRDKAIIATKVTGAGVDYIYEGLPISANKIRHSIEDSLTRLQSDYIDLYQLHWPNRGSYHFRQWPSYEVSGQQTNQVLDNMSEALVELKSAVDAGKIRAIGLSNETCWGASKYLQLAEQHGLPRMVSNQNEYSLLCRLYDLDFAELSHHENIGLLAWSPLAAGLLSGKYAGGEIPVGSRRNLNDSLNGRLSDYSAPALAAYLDLAKQFELPPAQLALAFCLSRPFMASVIIGATSLQQLHENIGACEVQLSAQQHEAIEAVRRAYPLPM